MNSEVLNVRRRHRLVTRWAAVSSCCWVVVAAVVVAVVVARLAGAICAESKGLVVVAGSVAAGVAAVVVARLAGGVCAESKGAAVVGGVNGWGRAFLVLGNSTLTPSGGMYPAFMSHSAQHLAAYCLASFLRPKLGAAGVPVSSTMKPASGLGKTIGASSAASWKRQRLIQRSSWAGSSAKVGAGLPLACRNPAGTC